MGQIHSRSARLAIYGAGRLLASAVSTLEPPTAGRAAAAVSRVWYSLDTSHRNRALENLARALPEELPERREALARDSFTHLLQLVAVDLLATPRLITPGNWHNHVQLGDLREALDLMVSPRPVILLTGHCGNFELLGYALAALGFPSTALARPLDLPEFNDWLVRIRQRRGLQILTRRGAAGELPELLQAGERVCFIADQNAGDKGLFVPFFNRLASVYKSIALLAMRFNTPIVCGHARRLTPGKLHYRIEIADIIRPEHWAGQPDPLYYITARYTRAIEQMVRNAPEQYFWLHRRWKSRPRHERLGRPFPESLRRQIEALPWVTTKDMEAILANSETDAARIASGQ